MISIKPVRKPCIFRGLFSSHALVPLVTFTDRRFLVASFGQVNRLISPPRGSDVISSLSEATAIHWTRIQRPGPSSYLPRFGRLFSRIPMQNVQVASFADNIPEHDTRAAILAEGDGRRATLAHGAA